MIYGRKKKVCECGGWLDYHDIDPNVGMLDIRSAMVMQTQMLNLVITHTP
jgi:hypothetical protein